MNTVIIVSKCSRVTKFNSMESWYEFHFKGVYAGASVQKVILRGSHNFMIKKNEEYLMFVQLLSFENGILKGNILKSRALDECWDKS